MAIFRKASEEQEKIFMAKMVSELDKIYSNKSGDEYKMHGDITKSPVYNLLQRTITDLPLLKGLNKTEAMDLKRMFDMLHRPNFKKIVSEYIATKKSECIMMTATFTVAYRVLISELSNIYTSTEATDKGFVYKPSRTNRHKNMGKFIRTFNMKIDSELSKSIRATTKSVKPGDKFKMEMFVTEGFINSSARFAAFLNESIIGRIAPIFKEFGAWCRLLFPDVTSLNPISWFSNMLSRRYDNQVNKYYEAAKLYVETKNAYDEYMKNPAFKRNKKVESNYLKNINKYNIKMQNAQAAIAHFDQRAIKETIDEANRLEEMEAKMKRSQGAKTTSVSDEGEKSPATTKVDNPTTESKPKPSTNDNDPFDF